MIVISDENRIKFRPIDLIVKPENHPYDSSLQPVRGLLTAAYNPKG